MALQNGKCASWESLPYTITRKACKPESKPQLGQESKTKTKEDSGEPKTGQPPMFFSFALFMARYEAIGKSLTFLIHRGQPTDMS
jgi:hypothetical protein